MLGNLCFCLNSTNSPLTNPQTQEITETIESILYNQLSRKSCAGVITVGLVWTFRILQGIYKVAQFFVKQTFVSVRSWWVGAYISPYVVYVTAFSQTDLFFSVPFLLWKKGSSGPVTQWRRLVSCNWAWHSHGSLIPGKFDRRVSRSMKTPWQECRVVVYSYSWAAVSVWCSTH